MYQLQIKGYEGNTTLEFTHYDHIASVFEESERLFLNLLSSGHSIVICKKGETNA